jgi:hypothetical protein
MHATTMRALIMLTLFVGMAMVIHSIYEEKLERAQRNVRVEYRFLPRTVYEEQLAQSTDLLGDGGKMSDMFSRATPWG